jgi:hypothetical protein
VIARGVVTVRVTPDGGTPAAAWDARRTALVREHDLTVAQLAALSVEPTQVVGRTALFQPGFYLDRRSGAALGNGGREDSVLDVADGTTLVEIGVDLAASTLAQPSPGQMLTSAAAQPEEEMAVAMAAAVIPRVAA